MHRGDPVETLATRGKSWRSPLGSTDSVRSGQERRVANLRAPRWLTAPSRFPLEEIRWDRVKQAHSDSSSSGRVQPVDGASCDVFIHAFDAMMEGTAIMAVEVYISTP
jgi:hypothetical protein